MTNATHITGARIRTAIEMRMTTAELDAYAMARRNAATARKRYATYGRA